MNDLSLFWSELTAVTYLDALVLLKGLRLISIN